MRRRSFLLGGLAVLAAAGHAGAAETPHAVPPGTVVLLEFRDAVSSEDARPGDEVALRVYADVVVSGRTLIRQDAPATGVVTEVRRPGRFGRRARLRITLRQVKDVDGNHVPLEPYSSGERFRASGPGAAGAGLVILGPIGLIGGIFVKGSHVEVKEGTRIQAKVADPRPKSEEKPGEKQEPDETDDD